MAPNDDYTLYYTAMALGSFSHAWKVGLAIWIPIKFLLKFIETISLCSVATVALHDKAWHFNCDKYTS